MSKMSELCLDIEDLLIDGYSHEAIAEKLNVPVDWVQGVESDMLNQTQDEYDIIDL